MFDEILNDVITEDVVSNDVASNDHTPDDTNDSPYPQWFVNSKQRYMQDVEALARHAMETNLLNPDNDHLRFSTALNIRYLRNKSVLLIGVGGLGNPMASALVNMGIEKLTVVDMDTVEQHNIKAQNHRLVNLGEHKVKAVAEELLTKNFIKIRTSTDKIVDWESVLSLYGNASPDIVITCVDNQEVRKALFGGLEYYFYSDDTLNLLPELFIDLRMTLGDFTAFILPVKAMYTTTTDNGVSGKWINRYNTAAMFPQEEAVQEPCTARAIAYTPMVSAAYTCSFLHWWANEGRVMGDDDTATLNRFFGIDQGPMAFKHAMSFSVRDFEFISRTDREQALADKIAKLNAELTTVEALLAEAHGKVAELLERGSDSPVENIIEASPETTTEESQPEPQPEQIIPVNLSDLQTGSMLRLEGMLRDEAYNVYEVYPNSITAHHVIVNPDDCTEIISRAAVTERISRRALINSITYVRY